MSGRRLIPFLTQGKGVAVRTDGFKRRRGAHVTHQEKTTSSLASLALYERPRELFPNLQTLIGEIKGDRILPDVPIDSSMRRAAFLSLRWALLRRELTTAAFEVRQLSAVVWGPSCAGGAPRMERVWLHCGGKNWMNPLDREARLKPRQGGAEARQGRGGDTSVTLGLTGKKPASADATEIEPHQMERANV